MMRNMNSAFSQPAHELWNMKGTLIKHTYGNNTEPDKPGIIFELKDTNALPIWFATDVHEVVCFKGECRPLNLWVFWNGTGGYLGFDLYRDEQLMKTDHVEFTQDDYAKLHHLLADTGSILKNVKKEDLIIDTIISNDRVDAYTGPTRPSLQEALVKNAAYSCYALWHTVYGTIQKKIVKLIEQEVNASYLKSVFDQKDSTYKLWAVHFIKRHPEYDSAFLPEIMELIKNNDENLSVQALNYFEATQLSQPATQAKLASMMDVFPEQRQYELLWKLKRLNKVNDNTIWILLEQFNQGKVKTPLLGYIYDLIQPENFRDDRIEKTLNGFLSHKNLYIRMLTSQLLNNYKKSLSSKFN